MEKRLQLIGCRLVGVTFVAAEHQRHVVLADHGRRAPDVVEVRVRVQQAGEVQAFPLHRFLYGFQFVGVESPAVHERGLLRLVPEEIAVLFYHVYHEVSRFHIVRV